MVRIPEVPRRAASDAGGARLAGGLAVLPGGLEVDARPARRRTDPGGRGRIQRDVQRARTPSKHHGTGPAEHDRAEPLAHASPAAGGNIASRGLHEPNVELHRDGIANRGHLRGVGARVPDPLRNGRAAPPRAPGLPPGHPAWATNPARPEPRGGAARLAIANCAAPARVAAGVGAGAGAPD